MPRPRAFTPLALEIISGRLPCAAGVAARAPFVAADVGLGLANRLVTVAAALPANEVRKNLRRDHWLMKPPINAASIYNNPVGKFAVVAICGCWVGLT